jgi:hypothetical protein
MGPALTSWYAALHLQGGQSSKVPLNALQCFNWFSSEPDIILDTRAATPLRVGSTGPRRIRLLLLFPTTFPCGGPVTVLCTRQNAFFFADERRDFRRKTTFPAGSNGQTNGRTTGIAIYRLGLITSCLTQRMSERPRDGPIPRDGESNKTTKTSLVCPPSRGNKVLVYGGSQVSTTPIPAAPDTAFRLSAGHPGLCSPSPTTTTQKLPAFPTMVSCTLTSLECYIIVE